MRKPFASSKHAICHAAGGGDDLLVTDLGGFPGGTTQFLRADGSFSEPPAGEGGAHTHEQSEITGLVDDLAGKEPADAAIQAHLAQEHAPSNAQKNSDITKAEIEAKLTGELTSHSHPAAGGGSDPWTYKRLPADFTISTTAAGDVTNGGELFGFTPAANKSYTWEAVLGLRTATATVNPRLGFAWSTGLTDGVCSIEQTSTATAKIMANGNIAASLLLAVGGIPTNTTSWPAICYGNVLAGANPSGNCRMQLASETAGTIVRVVAAVSYFRFRELP